MPKRAQREAPGLPFLLTGDATAAGLRSARLLKYLSRLRRMLLGKWGGGSTCEGAHRAEAMGSHLHYQLLGDHHLTSPDVGTPGA